MLTMPSAMTTEETLVAVFGAPLSSFGRPAFSSSSFGRSEREMYMMDGQASVSMVQATVIPSRAVIGTPLTKSGWCFHRVVLHAEPAERRR